MNKSGSIVIIEDDAEDQELFKAALEELKYPNEILFFGDGIKALEYLTQNPTQPFIILSDINLPKLNGFDLRDKIHNNEQLRLKCIPYIFFSTAAEEKYVVEAYSKSVQGFFTKPASYSDLIRILRNIIEYWKDCRSPNIIR